MNCLLFIYDDYADFQIGHLLFFLNKIGNAKITTVSLDGKEVKSLGGLTIKPNGSLSEITIKDYELIIFPGGDGVGKVFDNEAIHQFVRKSYEENIFIASICGSAVFLGKAGLLDGKSFTCNLLTYEEFNDVFNKGKYTGSEVETSESSFITAKGIHFAEFTVAVLEKFNLIKSEQEKSRVLKMCKGEI